MESETTIIKQEPKDLGYEQTVKVKEVEIPLPIQEIKREKFNALPPVDPQQKLPEASLPPVESGNPQPSTSGIRIKSLKSLQAQQDLTTSLEPVTLPKPKSYPQLQPKIEAKIEDENFFFLDYMEYSLSNDGTHQIYDSGDTQKALEEGEVSGPEDGQMTDQFSRNDAEPQCKKNKKELRKSRKRSKSDRRIKQDNISKKRRKKRKQVASSLSSESSCDSRRHSRHSKRRRASSSSSASSNFREFYRDREKRDEKIFEKRYSQKRVVVDYKHKTPIDGYSRRPTEFDEETNSPLFSEKNSFLYPHPRIVKNENNLPKPIIDNISVKTECIDLARGIKAEKYDVENTTRLSDPQSYIDKVFSKCIMVLKKLEASEKFPYSSRFLFTRTKLSHPVAKSEFQSPLLRTNNIQYSYSSSTVKYEDFGIISLSPTVSRVASLIGYDAAKLIDKLNSQNAIGLVSVKTEKSENTNAYASLISVNSTQTDMIPCVECAYRKLRKQNDIGTQAAPSISEVECQTENEIPLLERLQSANANQILSLNNYFELLLKPPATGQFERVQLQSTLLKIFDVGQKPCENGIAPQPHRQQPRIIEPSNGYAISVLRNDYIPPNQVIPLVYAYQNTAQYSTAPSVVPSLQAGYQQPLIYGIQQQQEQHQVLSQAPPPPNFSASVPSNFNRSNPCTHNSHFEPPALSPQPQIGHISSLENLYPGNDRNNSYQRLTSNKTFGRGSKYRH